MGPVACLDPTPGGGGGGALWTPKWFYGTMGFVCIGGTLPNFAQLNETYGFVR